MRFRSNSVLCSNHSRRSSGVRSLSLDGEIGDESMRDAVRGSMDTSSDEGGSETLGDAGSGSGS